MWFDKLSVTYSLVLVLLGLLLGVALGRTDRRTKRPLDEEESEWSRHPAIIAALAMLIGMLLRLYNFDFGYPFAFHPDELPKTAVIKNMLVSGSFNPHYFLHPSLLLYLALGISNLSSFLGGVFPSDEQIRLSGRIVSVVAGTLSIGLTYGIGKQLFSQRVGASAALLLALFPLHVTCSRYMKEDALLVTLLLASLYFALRHSSSGKLRFLILAFLCAGFSISSKYTGVLAIPLVILPSLFMHGARKPMSKRFIECLLALPMTVIAFLIGTPYAVLAYDEFLAGVMKERAHLISGHNEHISAMSQWGMYHLGRSLVPGTSLFFVMICVGFLGLGLLRRNRSDLILIFAIFMFYLIGELSGLKPAPQPERYVLTLLPFMALAIAEFCRSTSRLWGSFVGNFVFLAGLFLVAERSMTLARDLRPDTREVAASWIVENLPEKSRIVMDFQPYSPYLPEGRFEILNNAYLPVGSFLDISKLRRMGADYLVLSSFSYDRFFSQPGHPPFMRVVHRKIFENLNLKQEIASPSGSYGFHNPTIRIYSVKESSG